MVMWIVIPDVFVVVLGGGPRVSTMRVGVRVWVLRVGRSAALRVVPTGAARVAGERGPATTEIALIIHQIQARINRYGTQWACPQP